MSPLMMLNRWVKHSYNKAQFQLRGTHLFQFCRAASSYTVTYDYDVYLSSCGRDTRPRFLDHLYASLIRTDVRTFINEDEITQDGELTTTEKIAIRGSRLSVVTLSEGYLGSRKWFEQLYLILDYRSYGTQSVLPVLYHIDLSKKGIQKILDPLVSRWGVDDVSRCREALEVLRTLSPIDVSYWDQLHDIFQPVNIIMSNLGRSQRWFKIIDELFISFRIIGYGCEYTTVYEGVLDGRPAAVKLIPKWSRKALAFEGKRYLIDTDHHPNIVTMYSVKQDSDYVYIALELCDCNLEDLIESKVFPEDFKLKDPDGYASPEHLELMRDMFKGLDHLHKHEPSFIHRGIKPQNVLVRKVNKSSKRKDRNSSIDGDNKNYLIAKISEGISKHISPDTSILTESATGCETSGWQAPEVLKGEEQKRSLDMFSAGCVLYYSITGGQHPYGNDASERDRNILKNLKDLSKVDHISEASHLINNLLDPDPEQRLTAAQVLKHPLFMDPESRILFLKEASDSVFSEGRGSEVWLALEGTGKDVLSGSWVGKLDQRLLTGGRYGIPISYDGNSVCELLRLIRYEWSHFTTNKDVFNSPSEFEAYFRRLFPKLLIEVHKVIGIEVYKERVLQVQGHQKKYSILEEYYPEA